jgi:hypothetical protein
MRNVGEPVNPCRAAAHSSAITVMRNPDRTAPPRSGQIATKRRGSFVRTAGHHQQLEVHNAIIRAQAGAY